MARPTTPTVTVELDKPRHLLFSLGAIVKMEEQTGRNLLVPGALNNLSARDLQTLLWACLQHEDPELTLEDVGNMVHAGNMLAVSEAVSRLITVSTAKGEGEPSNPTKNRRGG